MRSRTFLNVSLGILALAAAYHLGAQGATAQTSVGNPIVLQAGTSAFVTANGDIYESTQSLRGPYIWTANIFSASGPTDVERASFGSLKVRYRGERESQGVKPSTNR